MRYPKLAALVAAIGLASAALALGQSGVDLKPGDSAPDFSLPGSDGKTWKLSELARQDGRPRLVPESVHRWLNGRVHVAP